jgi:hypothetical protein
MEKKSEQMKGYIHVRSASGRCPLWADEIGCGMGKARSMSIVDTCSGFFDDGSGRLDTGDCPGVDGEESDDDDRGELGDSAGTRS